MNKRYARYGSIAILILYTICIYRQYIDITNTPLTRYLLEAVGIVAVVAAYFLQDAAIARKQQNEQKTDLFLQIITYIVTILIAADSILTDSLSGMLYLSVLILLTIRHYKTEKIGKWFFEYILVFMLTGEVFLLLNAVKIVNFHSVMGKLLSGQVYHIVLVLLVVLYIKHWEKSKLWLLAAVVIQLGMVLIVLAAMLDAYRQHIFEEDWIYHNNCFNIISNIYEDRALTADGTELSFQRYDTVKNQRFYLEPAEEEGRWHIVDQNSGRVLDVCNVLFEEGNTVIAWDKNGVTGQMWQLLPSVYGYQIMAYQDGYRLSYDSNDSSIVKITQNEEDLQSQFMIRQDLSTRIRSGYICSGKSMIEIGIYGMLLLIIGAYGLVAGKNTSR